MKVNSLSALKLTWNWLFFKKFYCKIILRRIKNEFRQTQIFRWINFEGSWGRLKNWFNTKKIDLFYFIFTNLNLHNPLTTYFVLILLKGSNINQHMWSLTVSFGPIMFQKCWFSFFTSCSNFAIAQSSIGQLTKSWNFWNLHWMGCGKMSSYCFHDLLSAEKLRIKKR